MSDDSIWYKKMSEWNYKNPYSNIDGQGMIYNKGQQVKSVYYHEKGQLDKVSACYNGNGSCEKNKISWSTYNKKIGLMYISDLFLANGNTDLYPPVDASWGSVWITSISHNKLPSYGQYEWIMAVNVRGNTYSYGFYRLGYYGDIDIGYHGDTGYSRPVFYLNNDVELANQEFTENTGSISDPFLIKE